MLYRLTQTSNVKRESGHRHDLWHQHDPEARDADRIDAPASTMVDLRGTYAGKQVRYLTRGSVQPVSVGFARTIFPTECHV
jgi:hypothetical protein